VENLKETWTKKRREVEMKLGVLTVLFQDKSLEEALDIVADLGVEAV